MIIKKVGIAGSGRWAKVLISILNEILPKQDKIIVFSNHGTQSISNWLALKGLDNRVESVNEYKKIANSNLQALIIANAAKDHYEIAKMGIKNLIPLMVEKPLTNSFITDMKLINLSKENNISLALSQIFLFTEYLVNFKKLLDAEENISIINFFWDDKFDESRYGEIKNYDSSVPIYRDCMPHILSIVNYLVETNFKLNSVALDKDGSQLKIKMQSADIKLNVFMKRNAKFRKRLIQIEGSKDLQLDFTCEPGEIVAKKRVFNADTDWEKRKSPATLMISSFLDSISTKQNLDGRLLPCPEMLSLLNDISLIYEDKRNRFIKNIFISNNLYLNDIDYLTKEILLEKSIVSTKKIMPIIAKIKKILSSKEKNKKFNDLINKDIDSFVRMHIL